MNNKGLIKRGIVGSFLIIFIFILLIVILSISSSAIIQKETYILGEKVKINLGNIKDYQLKIKTPSNSYVVKGDNEVFIFKPDEAGKYVLSLHYQEKLETYEFEVISEEKQPEIKSTQEIIEGVDGEIIEEDVNAKELDNETVSYDEPLGEGVIDNPEEQQITINKPVRWNIHKTLPENIEKIRIRIPSQAENISVNKITPAGKQNLDVKIDKNTLTNTLTRIKTLNKNQGEKTITLDNVNGEIELEYYTEAPTTKEKDLSESKKQVKVSSPDGLHYENVLSYTSILEFTSDKNLIKVYWKEENKYLNFEAFDKDGNGLLDYVEWIVPHLSEQTFEISIEILNVQSYPVVGGNWEVKFNTLGKADLKISGINGTVFGKDLEFLEIKCGDTALDYEWKNNGIFIKNYECEEEGTEVSKVLTPGKHTLEFSFGDNKAYAYNQAGYFQIEWNNLTVSCENWVSVNFKQPYESPIVVATPEYTSTSTDFGISSWVRNVNTTGFELRASNQGLNCTDNISMNYIVMEEGNWTLPGSGIKVEAGKFNTTKYGYQGAGNWDCPANGERIVFNHTFDDSNPLVISVRATDSNSGIWAATFQHGPTYNSDVNSTEMCTGLSRSRAGTTTFTNQETIHYIVADTGTGNISNVSFEINWWVHDTGPSGDLWINGYPDGRPFIQSWSSSWSSAPQVIAVGQTGVWGSDGGWPVLYDHNITYIRIFTDESNERAHGGSESGGGWAFESSGSSTPSPVISNVNATGISDSSATIIWNTDINSNSSVNYGTTLSLGSSNKNSDLVLNHSILLSGLNANTFYYYNVTSCSASGVCSTEGYDNFTTITGTPPVIFNITPANNSIIPNPVTLSASTSENADCEYSTNSNFTYGTGTDFTAGQGTSFHSTSLGSLSSGTYTYYIKCEDLSANANDDSNQGSTIFTVDEISPEITLHYPIAGEIDYLSPTVFNWTTTDNFDTILSCNLYLDDSLQESTITSSNGSVTNTSATAGFGAHNWTLNCSDDSNNTNSETSWFYFGQQTQSSKIGEVGRVEINASDWTLVTLTNTFITPVIVTGYEFPFNNTVPPVSVRMRNAGSSSFEIILQLANSTASPDDVGNLNVTYLAVEQGYHYMDDGTKIEAYRYDTGTVSSSGNGWNSADSKSYNHTYSTAPVVFHQVMTYTDANWITTFASADGDAANPPTTTGFQVSLNGAEFTNSHGTETIGYVVIEINNGINDLLLYESNISGDIVEGVDTDPSCGSYNINLDNSYSSSPIALSSVQSMDGSNGGWSHICSISTTQVSMRIEEDQFSDDERTHITEDVSIFVFESAGTIYSNTTIEIPQIYDVNATGISDSSATIEWNTNITSNSTVYYGLANTSYFMEGSLLFVLNHSIQITSLSESTTYFYIVESCSETSGTCNFSGTFNFTTITGTPPVIFNITPANNSIVSNPVTLSASTSEDADCEYNTNSNFTYGTGTDFTAGQGTSFHSTSLGSLSSGTYTYYIKCEDLSANANDDSNQGSTIFTVDEISPEITLHYPNEGDSLLNNVPFNWTTTDNIDSVLLCNLTINSVVYQSDINSTNGTVTNTTQILPDGLHLWNITCIDDAGNTNTSETRSFTIGAYIITNVTTDKSQYYQGDLANITINATDLTSLPLETNLTTDIVLGVSIDNSTIWWNSSWQYRTSHRVKENSGSDLTNYQINITLDTQNLISQGYMNSDCSDLRLADSSLRLLNFYIQNSSYDGCNTSITKIWVQLKSLKANESTLIYTYSGNNSAGSLSSEFLTFNYPSFQNLYYVVSNDITNVDVISFVDGNNVSNGTSYVSLDRGDLTSFSANQSTIISSTGPIFAAGDANSVDALAPISFAGTEFVYAVNRYNDVWHVYSPFENATVCVYDGEDGSGWTLINSCFTVNKNSATTVTRNVGGTSSTVDSANTDTAMINSTAPVLITHDTDSDTDSFVLYPASNDWWGVPSTRMTIGILEDSTLIQVYYSNGSNINYSGNHGQDIYLDTFSTGGLDSAVHIISDKPIGVAQEADQDGTEMTTFLPEHELDTEYFIPQTASYIAVSATFPDTNCTLYNDAGTILSSSLTGSNQRPYPNKWYYGPDQSSSNIPAGSRLKCDQPVYAYYEQFGDGGDDDEHNVWSIKSSRKFTNNPPTITETGTQEQFIIRDINETNSNGLYSFIFNTTSQIIGNYTAISLTSKQGYNNGTGQAQFEILTPLVQTAPNVTLTNPPNNTFQNTSAIILYYNATDINNNIANSTLILNSQRNTTNQSAIINGQINNFTITLSDGIYTWTVNATDATNLEGTDNSTRTFTIDTQAPSIALHNPLANESFSQGIIIFNFTVTDNTDTAMVCDLIVDSTVEEDDFNAQNNTPVNFTKSFGAGTHLWNVTCLDNAGNLGISQTRNFTVTEEPPTVELITGNDTFTNLTTITLVYNATDNNGFTESRLILNSIVNQTNQTEILNGQYNNFTLTGLSDGIYTWTVNVTDTAGLNATAIPERTFTVDIQLPEINLNLPADNSFSNSSSLSFNFTAADNLDSSLTCSLAVGEIQDNNFQAINGTLTNRVINGLTDGLKTWNVSCVDNAGNYNISENRAVNITEYPAIQLNTANSSFFNTSSFNLSYTPSDNTNLSNCSLYVDDIFNQSNSSQINNGQQNNFSVSGISEGSHNWSVVCMDYANLQNQSETRIFTVDLDGLTVELFAPASGAMIFSDTVEFNYTATDNIDPVLDCNITINGVVEDSYSAPNGTLVSRQVTSSQGGFKLWNVTCIDDSSNTQTSETRNFTLAFAPIVTLNNPPNNSFYNSSSITLFYEVTDDNNNLANSTLILNGQRNITNQSAILNEQVNNLTASLPDGVYIWTVNVTDTTNLEGTDNSTRTFTIDTQPPIINLSQPENNSIVTWNNFSYNFTVIDALDDVLLCDIYVNGALNHTVNATNGTETLVSSVLPDGGYLWNVSCSDNANNTGFSTAFNFTMEAPPNVSLVTPENEHFSNTSTISFTYFVDDPIGITNCSIYIDDVLNDYTEEPSIGSQNTFIINSISDGYHNWTVECIDSPPDLNSFRSAVRNFTVDTIFPTVTLNSPEDNLNTLKTADFNFSVTDNLDDMLDCDLYIDGILNISSINVPNGSSSSQTINNLDLGSHLWNVSCVDNTNNTNWSETRTFNVTLADLMVNTTSIIFNNSNPVENETIMINATIYNLINVTVPNINVSFYDGDPDISGIQIGANQLISSISPLGQQIVNTTWNTDLATSQIFVIVDPPYATNGSIEEWNETNNKANKSVTIGGWHFVYGDIDEQSEFELAESLSNRVIRWNTTNFDSGNIYVVDSESSILWTNLQSIGRNTTGQATSNDFSDIDFLLNMTNFEDSVSNLYLNSSGDVINKTSFIVFNKLINNVPVANSTNNTNFMTGIFWDTSDDSDGEYDISDVEDIIFATQINKDALGAYGVYDYEIRIPANLREYIDIDSRKAVFYAELN